MNSNKYRHVFFDLDETLWDFKRNSLEVIHELIDQYRLEERGIKKDFFVSRYNHHNDHFWDLFGKGQISRNELRIVRWKTTLGEFKIHDEAIAKLLSEQYLQLLPAKKNLHDATIEILNYLKPKYSLHIITNGFEEVQLQKIMASGIAPYFTHIITSERAGSQKPNKEIFRYAFEIANATVAESIFIGDSVEADIMGAKAVAMDHVLFNPERLPHDEDVQLEITSLTQLRTIL